MTQRLHLVFGGELVSPQSTAFKDPSKIHTVGIFPDYPSAYAAWKAEAQRTVDDAILRDDAGEVGTKIEHASG